jgi:amidase
MDAMMVPTSKEGNEMAPHRSFKIKANFGKLRIGFVEPTIWKTWRKSGRINADAERFMVSLLDRAAPDVSTFVSWWRFAAH